MAVCSILKITHSPAASPTVLLNHDDKMLAEAEFSEAKTLQQAAFFRATHGEVYDRKAIFNSVTFSRIESHADHKTARAYIINHKIAVALLAGKTDFKIEITGGTKYLLKNASIEVVSSDYGQSSAKKRAHTEFTYKITGGKLEVTT